MNKIIKEHIIKTLELNSGLEDNISKLENKFEEILKVQDHVKNLIEESKDTCWADWFNRLKNDFPNYNYIYYSKDEKYPKVGVIFNYKNYKFSVLLEKETNIYYGIGRHEASDELIDEVENFTKPFLDGFIKSKWFYGWKYTSFANGYCRLKTLIQQVETAIKKN